MPSKQKILDALDVAIDDLGEDRLIDILLDAYKAKNDRILQLEGENCHERLVLQSERESLREESRRMRSDPLYGPGGHYFFLVNDHKIKVIVQGGRIDVFERLKDIIYPAQIVSPADWERL